MTTPFPKDIPPPPQDPPVVPGHRRTTLLASVAAVVLLGVGGGIGFLIGSSTAGSPAPSSSQSTSADAGDDGYWNDNDAEESDGTEYAKLTADDFSMELRTSERQCFGSAGCNVTVEPDITYLGLSEDLDPNATYEITYEITGDEDGPIIATAELTNGEDLSMSGSVVGTPSTSTKVTVEITEVITR